MSRPAAREPVSAGPRPVALLLPGQGAQHIRMAAGLRREPAFAHAMDEVFRALGRQGPRARADWLAARPRVPIDHVARAQPLLFAVDYALGRLVQSWGVRPAALLGHSMGELAAATLAGVFDLPDAVRVVRDRVRRACAAPPGGMVAVAATAAQVAPFLAGDVVVGVVNAPRQVVLAGGASPLAEVVGRLVASGLVCRRVPSTTGFHSPSLAAANVGAERLYASLTLRQPRIAVYSGYTAAPLSARDAADPGFWARQPVATVRFWPALDALLSSGEFVLVEAGPGQGLAQLARRHPAVRGGHSGVTSLLPARAAGAEADRRSVRAAIQALRAEGHRVLTGPPRR